MITVFFRYDDYSQRSAWEVDHGLISIFRAHGLCCTFAVIPSVSAAYPELSGDTRELPLAGERADLLREAVADGVVDLALHGWNHLPHTSSPPGRPTEFSGLPLERQVEILQQGKEFLGRAVGSAPLVFVPPWNAYDQNTTAALELVGISVISAHLYSPRPGKCNLIFAPITIELDRLREAIAAANSQDSDVVVGVMLHPYDFTESGDKRARTSLSSFEQDLIWLKRQRGVQIAPISALRSESFDMGGERYEANRPSSLESLYPPGIKKRFADTCYLQARSARSAKCRKELAVGLFFFAILLFGVLCGGAMGEAVATIPDKHWMPLLPGAGVVAITWRSILNREIYFKAAIILVALIGVFAGLLASGVI